MARQYHAPRGAQNDMSTDTNKRATPKWLINWLTEGWGAHIWLDACATAENAVVPLFIGPPDGLRVSWAKVAGEEDAFPRRGDLWVWMNPPYGRGMIKKWVEKARMEWEDNGIKTLALLPADLSTGWAKLLVGPHGLLRFNTFLFNGRLRFEGQKTGAMFASMLVEIGPKNTAGLATVMVVDSRQLEKEWG